jgi:hypothetical protein
MLRMTTWMIALGMFLVSGAVAKDRPPLPPDTEWADQSSVFTFGADLAIGKARVAEYPALAAAGDGLLVAWTEHLEGVDRVKLAPVQLQGAKGEPFKKGQYVTGDARVISDSAGHAAWPVLAADGAGNVWAVWSQRTAQRWRIRVRKVFPKLDESAVTLPVQAADGAVDCWRPALACGGERVFVAWEEMSPEASRVVAVSFVDPTRMGTPFVVSDEYLAFRPALAARNDACWLAWDEVVDDDQYEIFFARLDAQGAVKRTRVTRNPALDAAAAIALDPGGRVWLAWHSDRTPRRQWDIPKWPMVRCFDGTRWLQPAQPVPGRQDDPRGEDQGFEFPTLQFDGAGGLWLFGRPSHGFNAARFAGSAWSPVARYARPGWGGRGQYVRTARAGGALWTVRRDLHRIYLAPIALTGALEESPTPQLVPLTSPPSPLLPAPAAPPDSFTAPRAAAEAAAGKVFFGDVHMHTSFSDGMGTLDEIYQRAQTAYRLDFAVVTDHDDFIGNRILPSEWAYMQAVADLFNRPPNFVTLCGFEWTDARHPKGDGHKNVYYRGHGPMLWHTDPEVADGPKLFKRLAAARGICFPHHIGWTGVDWETHEHRIQTNVEICSVHGAYEYRGNTPIGHRGDMAGCFVRDGLGLGKRFGLVAGSDAHGLLWHHGIARRRNPWTHGLTGVYAAKLTREDVWDALAARRSFATSGPKLIIDLKVNDTAPGGVFKLGEPPVIVGRVVAPSPIAKIELIRSGTTIYTSQEDAETARIRHTDYDLATEGGDHPYYYLRVELKNGELAWTSPVFVDKPH